MKRKSLFDYVVNAIAGVAFVALIGFCIQSQVETAQADIPEGVTLRKVQDRTNIVNATSFILYASSTTWDGIVTNCCGDTTPAGDTIFGDTTCCDTTVIDTTLTSDTSQNIILGSARRASIQYQITHVDRDGVDVECDTCVNGRFVFQWSNDGIYWWGLDSTAAITDTLPHIDTMIVRPYAYVRAILWLTDPPNWVDDTTNESTLGSGREWIVGQGSIQPWYWPPSAVRAR